MYVFMLRFSYSIIVWTPAHLHNFINYIHILTGFCTFAPDYNYTYMRRVFLFIICTLLLSACNDKKSWVETEEGLFFWGLKESGHTYSWDGDATGPLIQGKGRLVVYGDNHIPVKETVEKASCGLIDQSSSFVNMPYGFYLGDMSGDSIPDGTGVLISDKEKISYGHFSNGLLDGKKNMIYILDYLQYKGGMKEGKYDGEGLFFDRKHVLRYAGRWKAGRYEGTGAAFNENNTLTYYGGWKAGQYNGEGLSWDNSQLNINWWKNGQLATRSLPGRIFNATMGMWFGKDTADYLFNYDVARKDVFSNVLLSELPVMLYPHMYNSIKREFSVFNFWTLMKRAWFSESDETRHKEWAETLFGNTTQVIDQWANHKIYTYNHPSNHAINRYVQLQAVNTTDSVATEGDSGSARIRVNATNRIEPDETLYNQLKERESLECVTVAVLLVLSVIIVGVIVYAYIQVEPDRALKLPLLAVPFILFQCTFMYFSQDNDEMAERAVNQICSRQFILKGILPVPIYDLDKINNVNRPVYSIQLCAVRNRSSLSDMDFSGLQNVRCLMEYDSNGHPLYRYLLGGSNNYRKMETAREQLLSRGFPGAYVVTFKGNKELSTR